MLYYFRHTCLILVLCLTFSQAYANDTADQNVERLQTLFEDMITQQQQRSVNTHTQITYDGDILVEPLGSYYAVTLPYMKIQRMDGSRSDVGIFSINVSAGNNDGEWKMAIAAPSSTINYNASGQEQSRITINQQRTIGIWSESIKGFTKLDLNLDNVTISKADKPEQKISIASVKSRFNFEPDNDSLWSGPAIVLLNDLSIGAPDGASKTKIDNIKMDITMQGYNLAPLQKRMEEIDADNVQDLPGILMDNLFGSIGSFSSKYTISGFRYSGKNKHPDKPDIVISFDKSHFGFGMEDVGTNNGRINIHTGFNNIHIAPKPDEYDNVAPSDANLNLTLRNVPFKDISSLTKQALLGNTTSPEMMKIAAMSSLMSFPALMTQAKAYLDIQDSYISGKDYKASFNGTIRADADASNSATGEIKLVFHGLDKMLAQSQMLAVNADAKYAKEFEGLKQMLETIKRYAKVETHDDSFVHILNIVMSAEGKILLNGEPFPPKPL